MSVPDASGPAWRTWPVGARVVVRRALPEGGLGDVLGDLLEVGPHGVVVATRRGPVRVDAGDIVLAKRVPPPPARRTGRGPDGTGPVGTGLVDTGPVGTGPVDGATPTPPDR